MTATPNYGGELPTIDADEDAWGSKNNTLHGLWDTTIKAVSDASVAGLAAAPHFITAAPFSASSGPGIGSLTGYNAYRVIFYGLIPSGNPTLVAQLGFGSPIAWQATAGDYAYNILSVTNLTGVNRSNGATGFAITQNTMDTTASKANMVIVDVIGPKAAGFGTTIDTKAIYWASTNIETDTSTGQIVPGYGSPTGVRLIPSTGTLTGAYVAYGLPGF